jgi:hypothetical protein
MRRPTLRHDPHGDQSRQLRGQVLFLLGVAGLVLGLLVQLNLPVPRAFAQPPVIGLSLIAVVCGATMLWRGGHPRTVWEPSRPGRRFNSAVFYSRQNCPLCDEAHELVGVYAAYLPELIEIDIDTDPVALERFHTEVPVLELDGEVRFRGRFSEVLLRRLIEATPPNER